MARMIKTTCCIVGGGPAGMMAGFLLARAGIDVTVLEKHADFLRDFRGDTIHPSTMLIMHELGLLDEFLKLPHHRAPRLHAQFGDEKITLADFSHLPVPAPYIALMPQWDFLNFMASRAAKLTNFRLLMQTAATRAIVEDGRTAGIVATDRDGDFDIHATLTIAADGRFSTVREDAGLKVTDLGAPMDVLWFRLSRQPDDTEETLFRFDAGQILIVLNRGDYWQCALVIPKGANDRVRAAGLQQFRDKLRPVLPVDPARADEVTDWDQVKLLNVQVNRLQTWWKPGLLCIGDAAHAMSPIGGVGVNLAVQDATAAANHLFQPLRAGTLKDPDLAAIQSRREFPTKMTQRLQLIIQDKVIGTALHHAESPHPPLPIRLVGLVPGLNRLPARAIGLGIRPEHVAPELRG
ncbi:MAG: FAD-dependent oxidoreductase [Alphaproteobacteria bacterium]|nr:FAD-dependent oxidoreductase [Alphaproteobacteria bacterium]